MNKKTLLISLSNILIFSLAVPSISFAQQWCKYDDPAHFRNEAIKLIEQEDDDFSKIKCSVIENSQILPEELVLPMPCGRKMVFRRVPINADHILDSEKVFLGNVIENTNQVEDIWQSLQNGPNEKNLAGGFTLANKVRNLKSVTDFNKISLTAYYIGKYEVTAHQYQLFSKNLLSDAGNNHDAKSSVCKEYNNTLLSTNENQVYPAAGLSWFDAIAFTRAYNQWLITGDKKRINAGKQPFLPWEQGSTGYVRLPTESEWEFAARGGLARKNDQSVTSYQIKDKEQNDIRIADIREIAIISQSGDDENPLSAVGSLLPNLLELYDVIGNVDEIVYDLFQLMPTEQSTQGRFGGYLVKGGNVYTNESKLSVAYRQEVPFFSNNGEIKSPDSGVRLAISVPIGVGGQKAANQFKEGYANMAQIKAMAKAKKKLVSSENLGNDRKLFDQELNKLRKLSEQGKVDQQTLKKQLNTLQASLERSNAELNDRAREVLRGAVKSAILTGYSIKEQGVVLFRTLYLFEQNKKDLAKYKNMAKDLGAAELEKINNSFLKTRASINNKIKNRNKNLKDSLAFYFQTVSHVSSSSTQEVKNAVDSIKFGDNFYEVYTKLLQNHVDALKNNRGILSKSLKDKWTVELDKHRKKRNEQFKNAL